MSYFVTGATGFIGRRLVERLLDRKGKIHVLVREDSLGRLDELIELAHVRRPPLRLGPSRPGGHRPRLPGRPGPLRMLLGAYAGRRAAGAS